MNSKLLNIIKNADPTIFEGFDSFSEDTLKLL